MGIKEKINAIYEKMDSVFSKLKLKSDRSEVETFTIKTEDSLQNIYESGEQPVWFLRGILFIKSRYAILSILFFIFIILIIINTAVLQLSQSSGKDIGLSSTGVSREQIIKAPRGNISDRYGVPLAVAQNINVLYLCNASLENDRFNAVILDLAKYLEKNNVAYCDDLTDYLSIDPIRFMKKPEEILSWQTNRNVFDLDESTSENTVLYTDKKYVKMEPAQLFNYLRFTLFNIDESYSVQDAYRIMRIRYAIFMDYWAFKNGKPVEIARNVEDSVIAQLEEQNYRFTGILSGVESERRYVPDAKYLGHVIGYMGAISSKQYEDLQSAGYTMNDLVGKSGVELYAERYLKGTDGLRPYNILTALGEGESYYSEEIGTQPVAGYDITLTIDVNLQKIAMESLKKNIEYIKSHAKNDNKGDADSGAVVMLDVKTGDTLVMASYPSFDPGDFIMAQYDTASKARMVADLTNTKDKPMLNRAIMEIYAPGSTFKPVTALAALEEGVNTDIRCGGTEMIGEWPFKCLEFPSRGHGMLTLKRGMATSCNIYFHKMGVAVGIDRLTKYMKMVGLGEYTGIDLPGEEKGYRSGRETKKLLRQNASDQIWFPADTAQTAIGQFDNRYTVIQLARYVSTLATGNLVTPHVIKEITAADGSIVKSGQTESVKLPVKASSIAAIREAMLAVSQTNEGTARSAFRNFEVKVACKTGTAETGNEDRSSSNALFICYAPAENPQVAIAQIIEKGVWGSNTLGLAKDLLTAYFGVGVKLQMETVDMPSVN